MRVIHGMGLNFVVAAAVMAAGSAVSVADGFVAAPLNSRRIFVFGAGANDTCLQRQIGLVDGAKDGMTQRDVVLQEVTGTDAHAAALRRRFGVSQGFHVVLLGRDGHVAAASDHPLLPRQIFQVIDSMPMRQEEMRNAKAPRTTPSKDSVPRKTG
jgi:hypothetical protein